MNKQLEQKIIEWIGGNMKKVCYSLDTDSEIALDLLAEKAPELAQSIIGMMVEKIEKSKNKMKPTHGTCCTCPRLWLSQ